MKYRVYQDGKPADNDGYDLMCWPSSDNSHSSIYEATLYALKWAYPFEHQDAVSAANNFKMEVGVPIDMSMGGCDVMMEIRSE